MRRGQIKISVIIPALNEAANIGEAIGSALSGAPRAMVEVIVADGGSRDNTKEVAASVGARVIETPPGRGAQMDGAARSALYDVLLFLHADTRLPKDWYEDVTTCLEDKDTVGGAFTLSVDSAKLRFRILEQAVKLRSGRYGPGLIYGDQALFARRGAFEKAGGFKNLPLMEDVDCAIRLRYLGTLRVLDKKVITSARRWERGGLVKNTLKNWFFLLMYYTGVSPDRLYSWYYCRQGGGG